MNTRTRAAVEADLAALLIEAGHHHRPDMDAYLVRTISRIVCRLVRVLS